ncbi:transposase [Komagataeibacter nataicola NRIC 0616]|nr:transposase [Komagataeibacter nataicola NRIC 0616]
MARPKKPAFPDGVLDQVLAGRVVRTMSKAEALLDDMKKALAERSLNAELDYHLDGEAMVGRPNCRNDYGRKTMLTNAGRVRLDIPRDRAGMLDLQLIARDRRRFPGFDDRIVSMYAHGMSVREIRGHLLEIYGMEASPDLISVITDAVLDEVAVWQIRPLETVYPVVFFDALWVKIRGEGLMHNKAVHIALGVRADGTKEEAPGPWIEQNEGAKFWLRVMNELRHPCRIPRSPSADLHRSSAVPFVGFVAWKDR